MLRSPAFRIALGVTAAIAALAVLRFKPWQSRPAHAAGELEVGFLPVT